MSLVFPPRNLGVADRWGREIETSLVAGSNALSRLAQDVENLQRTTNAQFSIIADQIATTNDLLSQLSAQQGELSSQQEQLLIQQGQLAVQQGQLQTAISNIPVTTSESSTISNFSIPNGTSNRMTLSFTTPSDKTRVSVFAVGQAFFFAPNPPISNAQVAAWRVRIGTVDGPFGNNVPLNMDGQSVTFMFSRSYAVPPNSTVFVYARTSAGANHPADASHSASLFATATFTN